ncbi:MAG: hypothetical protein J6Y54_03745 [Lentisphaeria bacterium]|nr:hypothetical protein [Lentisphaeria bacterium]
MKIIVAILTVAALAGCQSVTRVEYYEPTEANAEYCTPTAGNTFGHGPVKSIEGKSGVPDFSDGKSFNFNVSAVNL